MKKAIVPAILLLLAQQPLCHAVSNTLIEQSDTYTQRGSDHAQNGNHKDAIREFKDAISLNPENGRAHFKLGVSLYETGKPDLAVQSYRRALEVDPKQKEVHYFLATVLNDQGKSKEAIEEYRLAAENEPKNLDVRFDFGYALYKAGQYPEATDVMEAFLRDVPPSYADRIKWTESMVREMRKKRFSS
jgi:Tfp pilus assembly protein PilF